MIKQRREKALFILIKNINENLRSECRRIPKIYPADVFRAAGMPLAALMVYGRQDEFLMSTEFFMNVLTRPHKLNPLGYEIENMIRLYNDLERRNVALTTME